MKKFFTLFLLVTGLLSVSAQMKGDGYYRIQNFGTQRYAYLCDNTGFINYGTQNADVGALQLWLGFERTLDDPATVIYIKTVSAKDGKYDLQAQGTGIYQVIKHYVEVTDMGNNQYTVSATQKGITKYLSDDRTDLTEPDGVPGFQAQGKFRRWSVYAIDDKDNYVGITPEYEANGKYYQPYYVSFPFKLVSKGMKVYYVKEVDKELGVAVLDEVTTEIIPGAMPVVVECSSKSSADNKILPVVSTAAAVKGNMLGGVYFCNPERPNSPVAGVAFDAATMRTLTVAADGTLGLNSAPQNLTKLKMKIDGKTGTYYCLPANSSYLKVAADVPAELKLMKRADYETYKAEHSTVKVTGITLNETKAELKIGESLQLTATVAPDNAADKEVVWSTSDASVAKVSETGLVEAVALGTAVITATAHDGSEVTAQCAITVSPVLLTSITLNKTKAELKIGESLQLTATVAPDNATDKEVVWTTSDASVAKVSETGLVEAVASGTAVITATAHDGSKVTAQCAITVVLDDAITSLEAKTAAVGYYTLDGRRINGLQRGVNIIRLANGQVVKIVQR